ncbi:MAG: cadherin-like domain-containing protein [Pseudomonadota bacterium]|nr:cadherin-like domain-containing protein [Pseudomonadota bacterium]
MNDAPSFTAGPNQSVLEDAGPQVVSPWATAISPGPANESGQTVTFNITNNSNPGLFSAGPAVSSGGVLTFTPALNANGNASIMLVIQDSGGTGNGGVNTSGPQGFSITVTPVNDAPQVTPPAAYPAHAHIGITIPDGASDLFDGSTITDVDGRGCDTLQPNRDRAHRLGQRRQCHDRGQRQLQLQPAGRLYRRERHLHLPDLRQRRARKRLHQRHGHRRRERTAGVVRQ